ncbi:MAG TPA: glycosyltransferase family 4 protein [Patescibacteria group bacterium]|nr:glycosyltransferase family 4 protein [Patescibacteria group bacterium]
MRVLHFSCVAPPEYGGIGSVAYREVSGLRSRGIDARLVAPEPTFGGGMAPEAERSFIERIKPTWRWGNGAIFSHILPLARQADILHVHYPFLGVADTLLLNAFRLPPIVMTFHMDARPSGIKGWLARLHRLLIQPILLSQTQKVLVSSYDYAQHASIRSFVRSHPERVSEVPFGIDTEFFSPGESARRRFFIPDDAPVLMAAGVMDAAHAFKGIPELLRAMTYLDHSVHLLLAGDGDRRVLYEELAQSLGLFARVHFLGRIDNETLRDAYRTADLFIFPSTSEAEAFGLVAAEALAVGTPVVASSLPGVRTLVRPGETGLLVHPKNIPELAAGIKQLLGDSALRSAIRLRAPHIIRDRYSWEQHLNSLQTVYREVLAASVEEPKDVVSL